jgi:hypothetical protein
MSTPPPNPNGQPDGLAVMRLSSLYDGEMNLRYLAVLLWHGLPPPGTLTFSLGNGRQFEAKNLVYLADIGDEECEKYAQAIIAQ